MQRIAIYPGTFDPVTNGHVDLIRRGLMIADKVIVAAAKDTPKDAIFLLEKRCSLLQESLVDGLQKEDVSRVEIASFEGLLVDFALARKANIILRGLRTVGDFEYEFQMASMNARLRPNIETIFLPASENHLFIASRLVKEVCRLGGDISEFVPKGVEIALQDHYQSGRK